MGRQASFEGASRGPCEVAEAAPRCTMNHRAKLALNPRRRLPQTPALRLSSVVFFRRHDLRESQLHKQPCGTKAHAFLRAGKNWKCFLLKTNGRQQPLRALFPEAALCDKPAN